MNSNHKKQCLRMAGILLSACMIGGSIAPHEIFTNSSMIHASAFTSNGVNYVVDTAEKRVIADSYTGTDKVIRFAVNSSYPITSYTYEIGDYVFKNNSTLEKVFIPDGYTSIGEQAFRECSALTTVDLSEASTLKEIRNSAFQKCKKLSVVTLPSNQTSNLQILGNESFSVCPLLSNITITDSIEEIGYSAFEGCSSLKLRFSDISNSKLKKIGHHAFCGINLPTTLKLPSTVSDIGFKAFYEASGMETLDLSDCQVFSLEAYLCYGCPDLKYVNLPTEPRYIYIYEYAFAKKEDQENKYLCIRSYDKKPAYDTKDLEFDRDINPRSVMGESDEWGEILNNVEMLDIQCYPNSALAMWCRQDDSFPFDCPGDANSENLMSINKYKDADIRVKASVKYFPTQRQTDGSLKYAENYDIKGTIDYSDGRIPHLANVPNPLPGKRFRESDLKLGEECKEYFTLDSVACYDAVGNKLKDGDYFCPDTNYYYSFTVSTIPEKNTFYDMNSYLTNSVFSADIVVPSYAESRRKAWQDKYDIDMFLRENACSYITDVSADDCASVQTFTFNVVANIEDIYVYHLTGGGDVTAEDEYPFADAVTGSVAGAVSYIGSFKHDEYGSPELMRNALKKDLYRFAKPKLDISQNEVKIDYVFADAKYKKSGVPTVYYGYQKEGETSIHYTDTPTISGLEPDTAYTLYLAERTTAELGRSGKTLVHNNYYSTKFRTLPDFDAVTTTTAYAPTTETTVTTKSTTIPVVTPKVTASSTTSADNITTTTSVKVPVVTPRATSDIVTTTTTTATYVSTTTAKTTSSKIPVVTTNTTSDITTTAVTTTTATAKTFSVGDLNGDNSINLKDVVMLRRYIAGGWNVKLDDKYADINKDGAVNLKDVVLLRRYIAGGWNVKL